MKQKDKKNSQLLHLIDTYVHHKTTGKFNRSIEIIDTYHIGKFLGSGGFASCFQGTRKRDSKKFALKIIDKTSENMKKQGAAGRLRTEVQIIRSCSNEHIIKLDSYFEDSRYHYLVIQLCEKNSLQMMLKNRSVLTQSETKYFMLQIMQGLLYLQTKKIIHRDIKNCNIMLTSRLNVKICDFGLATYENDKTKQRNSLCGTPNFMAPEVISKKPYSSAIDMWSSGIVAFSLLFGNFPFHSKQSKQIQSKILEMKYSFPKEIEVSECAKNFISSLLTFNPQQRLTPSQAIQHQFFKINIPKELSEWLYTKKPTQQQLKYMIQPSKSNRNYYRFSNNKIKPDLQKKKEVKRDRSNKKKQGIQKSSESQGKSIKSKKSTGMGRQLSRTQKKKPNKNSTKKVYENILDKCFESEKNDKKLIRENSPKGKIKTQHLQKIQKNKKNIQIKIEPSQKHINKQEQNQFQSQNKGLCGIQKNQTQALCGYSWIQSQLKKEDLFVSQFRDKTQRYGFCFYLSNSVKIILFNDRTEMAGIACCKFILYKQLKGKKISKKLKIQAIKENQCLLKKYEMLELFSKQSTHSSNQQNANEQMQDAEFQTKLSVSTNAIQYWCRCIDEKKPNFSINPEKFALGYLFSLPTLIQIIIYSSNLSIYIKKQLGKNNQITVLISNQMNINENLQLPQKVINLKKILNKRFKTVVELVSHLYETKKKQYQYHSYKEEKLKFLVFFLKYCGNQTQNDFCTVQQ